MPRSGSKDVNAGRNGRRQQQRRSFRGGYGQPSPEQSDSDLALSTLPPPGERRQPRGGEEEPRAIKMTADRQNKSGLRSIWDSWRSTPPAGRQEYQYQPLTSPERSRGDAGSSGTDTSSPLLGPSPPSTPGHSAAGDTDKPVTYSIGGYASLHTTALSDDDDADSDDGPDPADFVLKKPNRTWRSNLWDTLDKSPEERRFLFKLDAVVLTFASLGYFIKYLDQVNINSAFVSGMKEDMGLYGNELNYLTAAWTVGYVIGEIPSNLILTRVRPSIWIPSCEVTWALLTVLIIKCTTVNQLYVLRFCIGLAESTFYPGMQYLIGSWYRSDELAKRSCIFHSASGIGGMVSGYLMATVYGLGGVRGYKGWQWLFICDCVISLPIAIAGFFFLPDVPEITRAWYFTKADVAIARRRMALEGRADRAPYTKAKVKRIFSSWHLYLLTALYICFNNGSGFGGQPAFQLWLKSQGYTIWAINVYPTFVSVVSVVMTFVYAWSSDTFLRGSRWPPIVFAGTVNIITYSSLAAWAIPDGWKWTCFMLTGFSSGISGLTFAWAHEICRRDNEERALVTGSMNQMAYVFQAWLPLVVWQQVDAPYYHKGFVSNIVISSLLIMFAFVIRNLHHKEIRESNQMTAAEAQELDTENEEGHLVV